MRIYDRQRAEKSAIVLRELADRLERGEIQFISILGLHTVEAARKYEYAFVSLHDVIESVDLDAYLLQLGVLRDHYLDGEQALRELVSTVTTNLSAEDEGHEFPT